MSCDKMPLGSASEHGSSLDPSAATELSKASPKKRQQKQPMEAARDLSELGSAKGGAARAKALSPEQRREIARGAARARWGGKPLPQATHSGRLVVGGMEFDCAVLEDGTRVVSETRFMEAMGMYRSGALSVRRRTDDTKNRPPLSLAYKNLAPYVEEHLGGQSYTLLKFSTSDGNLAHGIKAEIIPKVCEVWIDADRAGVLGPRQKIVAAKADVLLRGFAQVGIVALVDEATGYQDARARDALAKILEAFVAKELRKWVSTFPVDYYRRIYELKGWHFPDHETNQHKRSPYIGKITNEIVYDRLAPGIREELHRLTPRDADGRLKHKLHQRLTDDVGHPKLREHLAMLVALMKAAETWDQFKVMLNRAIPLPGDALSLPFGLR